MRETHDKTILNKMKRFVDLGLSVDLNGGLKALRSSIEISQHLPELVQVINHLPYQHIKESEQTEYLDLLKKAEKIKMSMQKYLGCYRKMKIKRSLIYSITGSH